MARSDTLHHETDVLTLLSRNGPGDVWNKCLDRIWEGEKCRHKAATALLSLARVNKSMRSFFMDQGVWERACRHIAGMCDTPQTISSALLCDANIQWRDRLRLYCFTGCMWCGAARIRKIYPQYGVRVCDGCLRERSVNEFQLEKEYGVKRQDLLDLPSHEVGYYNRYSGQGSMACFLWEDVLRKHGVTSREDLRRLAEHVEDESVSWDTLTPIQRGALRWRDVIAAAEDIIGPYVDRKILLQCPSVTHAASKTNRRFSDRQKRHMEAGVRLQYEELLSQQSLMQENKLRVLSDLGKLINKRHFTPQQREALHRFLDPPIKPIPFIRGTYRYVVKCPSCNSGHWSMTNTVGLLDHFVSKHLVDATKEME